MKTTRTPFLDAVAFTGHARRCPLQWRLRSIATRSMLAKAALGMASIGVLLLTGCASVGPPTITRDRFDYVTTISDSWKRQMLLNLLKVRYADAPVFMDVASVISSYSLEGDISLSGQHAPPGRGDTFANVGVTGRYADKPTITYQPLTGDKFAKSMMAPIPVTGLLFLLQSGYPADLVLRICVNSINGLDNAYGGAGNPRAGNPKFRELMTAMREAQSEGGVGFRVKPAQDGQAIVMFMRPSTEQAAVPSSKVRELLGLNATEREFRVVYGSFPERDTEVAILTRSILQVMIDFASYIDVPEADIAEGRLYSPQRSAEQARLFPALLTVRHGATPPDDAYVAIQYRNLWFWIDDRDHHSKQILTFLMLMFSLTEGEPSQAAPVVTVPAR